MKGPRLSRFHGFLLASGTLIFLAVALLGLAVGQFFESHLLTYHREQVAKIVQTQAHQHLVPLDFEQPEVGAGRRVFGAFISELPAVFRIKVYDRAGRIVWSDEPRLVGRIFPDDPFVARALRGEVATVLQVPRQAEHEYERAKGYVAETYVPIRLPGSPSLVGVIEAYEDATPLVREIAHTQRITWGLAAGVGVFLYVALAWVVWKASVNEQAARRSLEAQNRELGLIHRFARAILQPLDLRPLALTVVESAGTGLGLAGSALYRANAAGEWELLAQWPSTEPPAPLPAKSVAEWMDGESPVTWGDTVAYRFVTGKAQPHLFLARFPHGSERSSRSARVLEIMVHETAVALANVQLFTEIREAHERLAAILAGVTDQMVIVDPHLDVVWMNPVAAGTCDGAERALGRPCFHVLGDGPDACEKCPAVETFRSGKVERGIRAQRLPGGHVRYLDLVTAPLRDPSGQIYQVLEVARDITELVEMEERLKRSTERLERSHAELIVKTEELEQTNLALREAQARLVEKERLAAVGQLVVGLHDAILNPLAGLLGALYLLKQGGLTASATETTFAEAEAEIRKIEQLVRRLPGLRRTTCTPYVGSTTMLDLGVSNPGEGPE